MMTARRLLAGGTLVLMATSGCSGNGSGDGAGDTAGDAAGAGRPSTSASVQVTSPGGSGTSSSTPLPGGVRVQDGPAAFDLPGGVRFEEAPVKAVDGARTRTWRYAPDPASASCVIALVQQTHYAEPYPANERSVTRSRVELMERGTFDLDEEGTGPGGAPQGWVAHYRAPANAAAGKPAEQSVWSRSFLTPDRGYVGLAVAATAADEKRCQVEQVVRSLTWTGAPVPPLSAVATS